MYSKTTRIYRDPQQIECNTDRVGNFEEISDVLTVESFGGTFYQARVMVVEKSEECDSLGWLTCTRKTIVTELRC